jgi:hypothetical protein
MKSEISGSAFQKFLKRSLSLCLLSMTFFSTQVQAQMRNVDYFLSEAARAARNVSGVEAFAESRLNDYQFYHTYVAYRGAEQLSDRFLGSWEFADRIENLRTGWAPVDHTGIENVKRMAAEARKRTGVDYKARVQSPLFWLDKISKAEPFHLSEIQNSAVQNALVQILANEQFKISIEYSVHSAEFDAEDFTHTWNVKRFRATGRLHRPTDRRFGTNLTFDLGDFELRSHRKNAKLIQKSTEEEPLLRILKNNVTSMRIISKMKSNELRRSILRGMREKGFSEADLMELAPRERGVLPQSCKTSLRLARAL